MTHEIRTLADDELITPSAARALLSYDPNTGKLFWRHRSPQWFTDTKSKTATHQCNIWNAKHAGQQALCKKTAKGYLRGTILGRKYMAHRVIWLMSTGHWPHPEIDHRDGDRSNNVLANLRISDRLGNCRNRSSCSGSSSQYLGVSWSSGMDMWRAQIANRDRTLHIGYFHEEVEAAKAYDAAAIREFGDYAKPNFGGVQDGA